MGKKIVFFDIDGTIADFKCRIPQSAVEAIRAAREKGIYCAVNTGRPYVHIEPAVVDIGFDAFICSCGQLLVLNGETVFRAEVNPQVCEKIVALAWECRLDAYYEAEESMRQKLCHEPDAGMKAYLERMIERGFPVWDDPFEEGYVFDKFCVWQRQDSNFEAFAAFAREYYTLIDRGGGMYECILKGYSKETGLHALREMLGAEAEECYAIGDSANDLPMLKAVGHGIAMGEAPEHVKAAVEYVTANLYEDGLAKALAHYGLC